MSISKLFIAASLAVLSLTGPASAQASEAAPALQRVNNPAFAGLLPAGWRVNSYHFEDFVIYQVMDVETVPTNPVEIFGVYHGTSIDELNLTQSSIQTCSFDNITVTQGRSEASATQSGMTHLLIETEGEESTDYVHMFSTMLDMTDPVSLASRNISLRVSEFELADLICY